MNDNNSKKLRSLTAVLNDLQKYGLHVNWGGTDAFPYLRVDLDNGSEAVVGSEGSGGCVTLTSVRSCQGAATCWPESVL